MALGIALSTKADLGVSPISCTPYVLSLAFPLTTVSYTHLHGVNQGTEAEFAYIFRSYGTFPNVSAGQQEGALGSREQIGRAHV